MALLEADPTPSSQGYYWTAEWQAGEAESAAELEAGKGILFPDGASAAAWLREEEDG